MRCANVEAALLRMSLDFKQKGLKHAVWVFSTEVEVATYASWVAFLLPDVKLCALEKGSVYNVILKDEYASRAKFDSVSGEDWYAFNHAVKKGIKAVWVTTYAQLLRLMPLDYDTLNLSVGGEGDSEELLLRLDSMGYKKTSLVTEKGEFAVRGGIVDIYPNDAKEPVRLDCFDGIIETMSGFNPDTQQRTEAIKQVTLLPFGLLNMSKQGLERAKRGLQELVVHPRYMTHKAIDELLEATRQYNDYTLYAYYGVFHEAMQSAWEWIGEKAITCYLPEYGLAEMLDVREGLSRLYQHAYETRSNQRFDGDALLPLPLSNWLVETINDYSTTKHYYLTETGASSVALKTPIFKKNQSQTMSYERLKEQLVAKDFKYRMIVADSGVHYEAVKGFLKEEQLSYVELDGLNELNSEAVILSKARIHQGFIDSELGLMVLSDEVIFGHKRNHQQVRDSQQTKKFIRDLNQLHVGELVVHVDHGVGQFIDLKTMSILGVQHDCLVIEYSGGDKVYVPVENLSLIKKYGGENDTRNLDKLGGEGWKNRKKQAKEKILEIAYDMIKVSAMRKLMEAPVIKADKNFSIFCQDFPYAETEDQLNTLDDIMNDLEKGYLMDRLVCGDVGFGKTEVAFRTAFLVLSQGYQVAFMAPTTLLVNQHYENIKKRFANFPFKIAFLSRFTPKKEITTIYAQLASGELDMVIGTHALLNSKIQFKSLGLMVIDEEHHFGVKQKEKLKEFKHNTHVLTLTATPIPRTFFQAMNEIKDLSLITTPPFNRLPIETHLVEYQTNVIKEILLKEKARKGQSFFITPLIKDMDAIYEQLTTRIPELSIRKLHGQMPIGTIETTISDFYAGRFDVLFSTNIVESGLDIANANTMIVHSPERFGLAQLYQMRGRVGRSDRQAYVYLLKSNRKTLTHYAEKRLAILQSLSGLGSGFTLASYDIDLRGAGNIVGNEQSGNIEGIGMELYQDLLNKALQEVKLEMKTTQSKQPDLTQMSRQLDIDFEPQIQIPLSLYAPTDYIPDLSVRLEVYQQIAGVRSEDALVKIQQQIVDRFGPIPEALQSLFTVMDLKVHCYLPQIQRLDFGPNGCLVGFKDDQFTNPTELLNFMQKNPLSLKLRPDQKIIIFFGAQQKTIIEQVAYVKKFVLLFEHWAKAVAN